jgi:hypothetical protein
VFAVFFPFSVFGGKTQKHIENMGPDLLRIATGAPPASQLPAGFMRISMCEENLGKLAKSVKMQNPREGEHRGVVRCGEVGLAGGNADPATALRLK